jgi:hypothetical protein
MKTTPFTTLMLLAAVLAAGCRPDPVETAPPLTAAERAKLVEPAVLAAMPVPGMLDDARLRELLGASPGAAALEWFSEELMYEKDDTRFLSALMALVASKNEHIARIASDTVAGAYVVAAGAKVDLGPAIDVALKSPSAATRRIVVRNLGLPEDPRVRAWLKAHENDAGEDETDAAHGTVAAEVKLALARLNAAADEGRTIVPTDPLGSFECDMGRFEKAPAPGAEATMQVAATEVLVGIQHRAAGSPAEPVVQARVTLQTIEGVGVVVLEKRDAKSFSFGLNSRKATYLLAWSRAVSRGRARFWYRCQSGEGG